MEGIMTLKVALSACIVTLPLVSPVAAHHPGGPGNTGGAGPIVTIPATTLEQGHFGVATWYEFSRLGGLDDAQLIQAASKHIHAHSIGTIQSASSAVAYGVTDDFTLALRLPYVLRTNIREGHHEHVHGGGVLNTVDARGDSRGFGDAVLLAQGRFLNNVMTGTQAAFLIGVKAPTGVTSRHDAEGLLFEAEFQPGSGSWDGLFGLAMTQRFGAWSLDGNVLYQLTSTGTQDTNLGSRFLYNAAVSYRVLGATSDAHGAFAHAGHEHKRSAKHDHKKGTAHTHVESPSWAVDLVLELNGERQEMQKIAGVQDINSGGTTVLIAPGIRVSYGSVSGFVSVGLPVVNRVNGLQSKTDYRVISGLAASF
jgi:hypothetical protein